MFLALTVIFAILVSFGKEFPLVYKLMFDYFPMFNKFRVPSMILILAQIAVPLLAAFGIASLPQPGVGLQKSGEKKLKYVIYTIGIILALSVVARGPVQVIYSSIFPIDEVGPKLAQSLRTDQPRVVADIYGLVTQTVATDLCVALGLLLIALGSVWLFLKEKLKFSQALVVLVVLSVVDLWRVDVNPMEPVSEEYQQSVFTTPEYVRFLQRDSSLYRTVTFIDGMPQQDNILASWRIQNVYGYHPAKLRLYQDAVDVASLGNPLLLQLMNVKYIISNNANTVTSHDTLMPVYDGADAKVANFRIGLPRAFFVRRWKVATGPEILKKIANLSFDPVDVAYGMEAAPLVIDPPQSGATATFIKYGLQDFALHVTATGNNLLFLSEVYYPHGWKAFIDGKETAIYQLNYLFRGVVVPVGSHTLEMKFNPDSFRLGRTISFVSNILLLGGLAFAGAFGWRKKRNATRLDQT
jgi:hypothetical protein